MRRRLSPSKNKVPFSRRSGAQCGEQLAPPRRCIESDEQWIEAQSNRSLSHTDVTHSTRRKQTHFTYKKKSLTTWIRFAIFEVEWWTAARQTTAEYTLCTVGIDEPTCFLFSQLADMRLHASLSTGSKTMLTLEWNNCSCASGIPKLSWMARKGIALN